MKLTDINIRDPFILTHEGKYYLYGTRATNTWIREEKPSYGFDTYVSEDMENWNGPISIFENYDEFWGEFQFWAPEVHKYNGKFYLLATFASNNRHRGTAILECDSPCGTFKVHSDGAVTPSDWECLDGTLYVENETPYMIFCHEWTQIKDGEICYIELSKDLKRAVSQPKTILKASDAKPWVVDHGEGNYVTDGPFLMKLEDDLICLWSSFGKDGYVEAIARSDNGKIGGNWTIDKDLLFEKDGGHGMIFEDLLGNLSFTYHSPNETPLERPCIRRIEKSMLERK